MFGIHHIFFPPRLRVVSVEVVHDGYGRDGVNLPVFDHVFLQEFERPMICACRRISACQGDQMGFCFVIKLPRLSRSRRIVEGAGKTASAVGVSYSLYGASVDIQLLSNSVLSLAVMGHEQYPRPCYHAHIAVSPVHDTIEFSAYLP